MHLFKKNVSKRKEKKILALVMLYAFKAVEEGLNELEEEELILRARIWKTPEGVPSRA